MRALFVLLALLVEPAAAQRTVGWEARIPEKLEVTLGEPVTLPVVIAVDRGLVISKDAPVILDIITPNGVSTRKPRQGRPDAVDPEADAPRFSIPLKTSQNGEHVVKLRLRMWLCGGRSCRPIDVRRQTTLVVNAQKVVEAPP